MSNKKTTTTTTKTNFDALLSNEIFLNNSRFNEISNLQKDIEIDENLNFERTLRISEHFKNALDFFTTDEAKEIAKECHFKLTNEVLSQLFGYSLAQFNRYKAVAKLDIETIKEYKEQMPKNRGLDSLIKFSNKPTNEMNEETSEETSVKIESLQIKVGKDNKISIKGKASKEVITLLIEELKKMM